MSLREGLQRVLSRLARMDSQQAEAILDTLLEMLEEEADKATAEQLLLDAWEGAGQEEEL